MTNQIKVRGHNQMKVRILLPVILMVSTLYAQNGVTELPMDVQMKLILKIISYDRNLNKKVTDGVNIGILFKENDKQSKETADKAISVLGELAGTKISGHDFNHKVITINSGMDLSDKLKNEKISYLFLSAGLEEYIDKITTATKELEILSMSCVPKYLDKGVSLAFDRMQNKAVILLRKSYTDEGSNFPATFLKLAKIIE